MIKGENFEGGENLTEIPRGRFRFLIIFCSGVEAL